MHALQRARAADRQGCRLLPPRRRERRGRERGRDDD